ncbi:Metallo-beta-lactamase domain-containing protein [Entamoeba marina]
MALNLQILGCAGNIGFKGQSTCFMCYVGEKTNDTPLLLIDGGTGITRMNPSDIKNISDVALTHSHLDHVCGISLMVESFFNDDIQLQCKPTLHCGKITLETLEQTIFNKGIWMHLLDFGFFNYSQIEDGETHTLNNGITITAVKSLHSLLTLGYLVKYQDKAFAFTGDTTYTEEFWKRLSEVKELKAVISEVSLNNDLHERAVESNHMTPDMLQKGIKFLSKDVKIYASHIKSYSYNKVLKELSSLDREVIILKDEDMLTF